MGSRGEWDSYESAKNRYNQLVSKITSDTTAGASDAWNAINKSTNGIDLNDWYSGSATNYYNNIANQIQNYYNQLAATEKAEQEKRKAVTDARESTIAGREAEAKNNYTQARTQGLGKGLAASIGNAPLAGSTADSYQANYGALQNAQASTQNDYLNKLGYANALQNQADNMNTGSTWNTIGAFMQGMGGGAAVGSSIGGAFGKGDK